MSAYIVLKSEDRDKSLFPEPNNFSITSAKNYFGESGIYNIQGESVQFFYNIPNINATNNTLLLNTSSMSYPVTVPEGFYDYSTLASTLATALNALAIGTFTVTWSVTLYRYVVTSTIPVSFVKYPPLIRDLAAVMGLPYSLTLATTIIGQSADLAYTRNIYITSNTLNRHKHANDQASGQQQDILFIIPVYNNGEFVRSNSVDTTNDYLLNPRNIFYQPHNMKTITWNRENIGDIQIRVYDDYDQPLYNGWGSQFSWSFRMTMISNK